MNIFGKITGINYKVFFDSELEKIDLINFNINQTPSSSILKIGKKTYGVSRWVSPKRTRSYPYERIYNTLNVSKKITVIPVIKDEGLKGDRDYLQWDTISLMSLLDIYVILAYYSTADKKAEKITNQQFDNGYVISKINEIQNYHSSALHWNLNELKINLNKILIKVKLSYKSIESKTKVKLHDFDSIDKFGIGIGKDVEKFMEFSRVKSKQAQSREFVTIQPKESLSTNTKAKISILNYLGGLYQFTVDEVEILRTKLFLIESKHSKSSKLPSKSDIKDGLIKIILYSNLSELNVEDKFYKSITVLKLTSSLLIGNVNSKSSKNEILDFFKINTLNPSQIELITILFEEANYNKFIVKIEYSK